MVAGRLPPAAARPGCDRPRVTGPRRSAAQTTARVLAIQLEPDRGPGPVAQVAPAGRELLDQEQAVPVGGVPVALDLRPVVRRPSSMTSTVSPSAMSTTRMVTVPSALPELVCSTALVTSSEVSRAAVSITPAPQALCPASPVTNDRARPTCSGRPGTVRLPSTTVAGVICPPPGPRPPSPRRPGQRRPINTSCRIPPSDHGSPVGRGPCRKPDDSSTLWVIMSLPSVKNDDGPDGGGGASA